MTRLLMSFRADEVSVGDMLALPFGPATVIEKAHVVDPEKGRVIELHVEFVISHEQAMDLDAELTRFSDGVWYRSDTFHPAPHEYVCLWELRP